MNTDLLESLVGLGLAIVYWIIFTVFFEIGYEYLRDPYADLLAPIE